MLIVTRDQEGSHLLGRTSPLDAAVEGLGYAGTEGYVDRSTTTQPTARAFVWRELERKGRLDAAYFRGAVPLVGFASVTDADQVPEVHRRLWNLSRVPLLVIGSDEQVGVYSCFSRPSGANDASNAEMLTADSRANIPAVLEEFSRFHVETGRVASTFARYFRRTDRVDRHLLANLRSIRSALKANRHDAQAVDTLIGRCMFIRYFEDRGILSPDHMEELTGHRDLIQLLRAGPEATYTLFSSLGDRFDGDLFSDVVDSRSRLDAGDLAALSEFLGATDMASGQRAFWPYDFSIIPPELISSIYEQLLEETQKQDAAYYTPRHVVDLILDEVLPWAGTGTPKILDPACGSGIFLAEAFRRLVFRNSSQPRTFKSLSELLKQSVFGVDQSAAAITVAAFGLYLAMLEEIDPPTVWRDARLPKLVDENLLVSDFFEDRVFAGKSFEIIVGNPPWTRRFTKAATKFVNENDYPIANNQLATAFLWKSAAMLTEGGSIGMLLPAKQLLHNKSDPAVNFRRKLIESLEIETVIDLSILRKQLFTASGPPAALIARRPKGGDARGKRDITHVVPRNTPLQRAIDGFVVSQEDVHAFSKSAAAAYRDIWKIYLWGADEDLSLITRLRATYPTVDEIAQKRGWIHRQGFQVGHGGHDSTHLLGMRLIESNAIHPFRVVETAPRVVEHTSMRRLALGAYEAPHVLIRRTFVQHRPAAVFLDEDAAFPSGVVGVAGPAEDGDLLKLLTAYVNSSLGAYFQFMTSSSWGVERDALEVNEYMDLPFAEAGDRARQSVLKVMNNVTSAPKDGRYWQTELDQAVFAAYRLTDDEINVVHDRLTMGLDQFTRGPSSIAFSPVESEEAARYEAQLASRLGELLPTLKIETYLDATSPTYAVATTILADSDQSQQPVRSGHDVIDLLLRQSELTPQTWPSYATIIQPSVVVLDGRAVHLLKPNESRYWTVRAATSDAARLLAAVGLEDQAAAR